MQLVIDIPKDAYDYVIGSGYFPSNFNMISEIRNGIPLDKIRTEIKAMFPPSGAWMYEEGHEVEHTVCEVLSDVLKIIDKYKAERSE